MKESSDSVQLERANGAYVLVIQSEPVGDAEWKSLRLALRMSRADLDWLRERVPGIVRRGAKVDLLPIAERVQAAGHEASVRRRSELESE